MTTKTFDIEVQDDFLQRISQVKKPILAVAELIWNAVDADADRVDVTLHESGLDALESIEVVDNGHGIPYEEAQDLFARLGGSWKKSTPRSHEGGRLLHGKEGRGRFRAFTLGRTVEWDVCYKDNGTLQAYKIDMLHENLKRVRVSERTPVTNGRERGVAVRIRDLARDFRSLKESSAVDELTQMFALYLRQYPLIKVTYSGRSIDPSSLVEHSITLDLPAITGDDGIQYPAAIEIVEWAMKAERNLLLCDAGGFPLEEAIPGVHAPGFNFTGYLKSDYFAFLLANNRLDLANLEPAAVKALESAKDAMREHFRQRAAELAVGLVAEWQRENIYPYEGQAIGPVEEVERQVFNVVALNLNNFLPEFRRSDEKSRRLHLRLLRSAIERGPDDLAKILNEVLDLPPEKRKELADLLERTTLSHIISASKVIADRLEFIRGLETFVFDENHKYDVRERTQLHRIVAENSWIFGEQYHLSVDDQSLTEVLRKHIEHQGLEIEIDKPVLRPDGTRGIVDLMLSRNIQTAGSEDREHLVVELKRPSVKVNADVITQIKKYAFAVSDDERFRGVDAKWIFWAISSDMDDYAKREVSQRDRPRGMLHQSEDRRVTIWVKTWSQVVNDCKSRLKFFSDNLNYIPTQESSLVHLKATYGKYLSDLFADKVEEPPVAS